MSILNCGDCRDRDDERVELLAENERLRKALDYLIDACSRCPSRTTTPPSSPRAKR